MGFENWDFPVRALGAVDRFSGLGDFTAKDFAGEMGMRGPFKVVRAKRLLKRLKEVYLVGEHWTGYFIPTNCMTLALMDANLCLDIGDSWMTCYEPLGIHCNLQGESPIEMARQAVRKEYEEKIKNLDARIKVLEDD